MQHGQTNTSMEPIRRRKRTAISCTLCRRRKLRCNKETPCSNCIRSKNSKCIYGRDPNTIAAHNVSIAPASTSNHTSTLPTPEITCASVASTASSLELEALKTRIQELEGQLTMVASHSSVKTPLTTNSTESIPTRSVESITTGLSGSFDIIHDNLILGEAQTVVRSVAHKNRVFGQSHWISSITLFQDIVHVIEPHLDCGSSKIMKNMQKAKMLARVIKEERSPSWPTPPTSEFPTKHVCDKLINCYLRTIETLHRVIHVPTFRQEYEAMWISDAKTSTGLTVQLKLMLAIGASIYDENFSMRLEAIRWVYEAQAWLFSPTFKSKLGLQFLQNNILLLLAREIVDVGGELIWISAGTLVRSAVYMGLHKDPAELRETSIFDIEMRRRIWNTILEISVQTSLVSGGLSFISLSDFSTKCPGNFDDEQLTVGHPSVRPDTEFTQTSVAIALRQTLPVRLAVVKFLNDTFSTNTYDATLRIDTELRSRYKDLKLTLQGFHANSSSALSRFELQSVDFLLHRYLISLHLPYFKSSLREPTYAFSRKVVVDSSLKTWSIACPFPVSSVSQTTLTRSPTSTFPPTEDDFSRLCRCGSGFFRAFAFQASTLIAVELRAQLQEDDSISAPNARFDLLNVLEEAPNWYLRCIEAGETGIKGYLLHQILAAQIDGLMQNIDKDSMLATTIKAAEEAGDRCLPLLENLRHQHSGYTVECLSDIDFGVSPEFMEDWDLFVSEAFDFGGLFD